MNTLTLILIPLLPFVTFVVAGLTGKKMRPFAGILGSAGIFVSLVLSLMTAYQYFFVLNTFGSNYQSITVFNYEWLRFTGDLSINIGFLIDPISLMMLVVVTLISFMVHIYSLGYMKGEERYNTYYSFLSLFTFSMLGLVIATNIFQTYIFWELVGVSSFLLIGYYYDRPSAVKAAKKAFIVTRFADLGFLTGILVLSYYAGTLDIQTMISRFTTQTPQLASAISVSFIGASALTWGLVLVFIGGAGKSAMFPLHVWLPDAMEGPTPVSALIHAATMVVAGVYLVARLFPIFEISCPAALNVVTVTGIFSALFAAIIACTQTDIKRILAYSTMSQIGFMMFSLGVARSGSEGGFTASMFHLFTHALFKALLFLCAGTVIHFIHSNEMKDMGGLRKKLPLSHLCFAVACLAISGIPPFAGFFSKEEILGAAYNFNKGIYYIALFTAGLTAFYMFRLFYSIFYSKPEEVSAHHDEHHPAEGGISMKLPLILLMIGAAAAGFIPFAKFVPVTNMGMEHEWTFSILPVAISLAGIILATIFYRKESSIPDMICSGFGKGYVFVKNKFYVDEIYLFVTKRIIFNLIGRPAAWIDKNIIDGIYNTLGRATQVLSLSSAAIQSGKVQQYAIWFLGGVLGILLLFHYLLSNLYTVL